MSILGHRGLLLQNLTAPPSGGPYADDYATIFAAWCASRKMIRAYSGPLIRIRRTNDNAEQDIGFLSDDTLDTAAISSFVGSNSARVMTVYEQTGNGSGDWVNTNASLQPLIVNAGVLEADYIQFNGSDFSLTGTLGTGSGINSSVVTMFAKFDAGTTYSNGQFGGVLDVEYNRGGAPGFAMYSEGRSFTGAPGVLYIMSGSSGGPYMGRSFTDAARSARTGTRVHTARWNLTTSSTGDDAVHAYMDGSDSSQATPASGDPSGTFNGDLIFVGRLRFDANSFANCGVHGCILVAGDALSVRTDIEALWP